jgi:acetoacetyl-CoA synthetase
MISIDHEVIWSPDSDGWGYSRIGSFVRWLGQSAVRSFADYDALWRWSTDDMAGFWSAIWEYSGLECDPPPAEILQWSSVANATWFRGARLNYADHLLRQAPAGEAIIGISQTRPRVVWTRDELLEQVARCRAGLVRLGIGKGDRVAGYLPNVPETIAAFLATASLGAIWTSCPPEFGTRSVIERFRQVEPKILLAVDGYRYGNRDVDLLDRVTEVRAALPTLGATVVLRYLGAPQAPDWHGGTWADFTAETAPLAFESVAFDHPLYILYSSGTTGLPKAIVHGHGGILLEHFKNLALHLDIGPGDRFFWFSTTGWMMWNLLVSGLLVGSSIVTFDGNPGWPGQELLWQLAEQERFTYFGVSATFLSACKAQGIEPCRIGRYTKLRAIGSTGSPLSPAAARWIYEQLPGRVHLGAGSGGTDICSGFVGAVSVRPVWADAMSCRYLGAKVEAFDDVGSGVIGAMGELVITRPMPSMPVAFWNDPHGSRLRAAYFDLYPGVWRHGDWITIHHDGSCVVHGRSDATLNRGGVRLGSAEFYALLETLPEVHDSLVVHIEDEHVGMGELILFVVSRVAPSERDALSKAILTSIRSQLSPRHVPDTVYFVSSVPRTLSGKKLEVPVKQILRGVAPEAVISAGALADETSLDGLTAVVQLRTRALREGARSEEHDIG